MISKHGKTLGKMLFHLAVVNSLGYDIKKTQLIPRFWFPVLVLIFAFFVSQLMGRYVLMSMLLFVTLFTLVSYCMVLFTKDHKGIHDYFALTMVINEKESIWFKDANEEERVTKNINAVSSKTTLEQEIEGKNVLYVNSGSESAQKENDLKTDD
jgi:predicted neutral ceramidase superfamily lipid hydrolase